MLLFRVEKNCCTPSGIATKSGCKLHPSWAACVCAYVWCGKQAQLPVGRAFEHWHCPWTDALCWFGCCVPTRECVSTLHNGVVSHRCSANACCMSHEQQVGCKAAVWGHSMPVSLSDYCLAPHRPCALQLSPFMLVMWLSPSACVYDYRAITMLVRALQMLRP